MSRLELRPVTKSSNPLEEQPARSALVKPGPRLVLGRVRLHDLVVEPGVRHRHPVLGQRARLVRADGRGGAQGLHGLQVLHKAVLGGHPLGGEGEADRDRGEQALGHVGHDDPDEEDDCVEPVVAEDEGDDEEADAKEDGDGGDDVDEVGDLFGDRSVAGVQSRSESSNPLKE